MADENKGAGVSNFSMTVAYTWNEGLMQLPVAGTRNDGSQKCAIVRTHSPCGTKVISWQVEAVGKPQIPSPEDADPTSVFLHSTLPVMTPIEDGTGNFHHWRASGVYTYALETPHGIERPFAVGKQPGQRSPGPKLTPDMFRSDITGG